MYDTGVKLGAMAADGPAGVVVKNRAECRLHADICYHMPHQYTWATRSSRIIEGGFCPPRKSHELSPAVQYIVVGVVAHRCAHTHQRTIQTITTLAGTKKNRAHVKQTDYSGVPVVNGIE